MNTSDKILQLLYHNNMNEREFCVELGMDWHMDIKATVDTMVRLKWVMDLPPYLTDKTGGRRYYITLAGRDEHKKRVVLGGKGKKAVDSLTTNK